MSIDAGTVWEIRNEQGLSVNGGPFTGDCVGDVFTVDDVMRQEGGGYVTLATNVDRVEVYRLGPRPKTASGTPYSAWEELVAAFCETWLRFPRDTRLQITGYDSEPTVKVDREGEQDDESDDG